jgi:hypothetical protein
MAESWYEPALWRLLRSPGRRQTGAMRGLIHYVHTPIPTRVASLLGASLVVVGAGLCVALSIYLGDIVSLRDAAYWSAISILPWFAAFELNKRSLRRVENLRLRVGAVAATLLGAMVLSGVLQKAVYAAHGHPLGPLGLHIVVHLPETMIVALLTVLAALMSSQPIAPRAPSGELPITPERIRWIKSAGNYVEIATPARVEMHRMTLGDAERLLDPGAFVRVNRSTIVARALIVRVKPGAKAGLIELADGRAVPIGQAYRSNFANVA